MSMSAREETESLSKKLSMVLEKSNEKKMTREKEKKKKVPGPDIT